MFKSRVESNFHKYKEQVLSLTVGFDNKFAGSHSQSRDSSVAPDYILNCERFAVECDVRKLDIEDKTNACFMRNRTHHLTRELEQYTTIIRSNPRDGLPCGYTAGVVIFSKDLDLI